MATSSFDTTFRINPDWGVKNLEKGLKDYEKNGPDYPKYSPTPILEPSDALIKKILKGDRK